MRIKRDAWATPPIFEWLRRGGHLDADAMNSVLNMGIGFAMIVRPAFTRSILGHLRRLGEKPYFLGKVKRSMEGEARVEWS
jgi:phosphoribosylformylglycinamidine cyclo-ligase